MGKVLADLGKALSANQKVKALWEDLTPIARRDFISWIESAKQDATRKRRLARVPDMLVSGKRRPCCYAVVPMGLYKTLGAIPEAKEQWKSLTPDERRDFNDWIHAANGPGVRMQRVERVCTLLASGKRRR